MRRHTAVAAIRVCPKGYRLFSTYDSPCHRCVLWHRLVAYTQNICFRGWKCSHFRL